MSDGGFKRPIRPGDLKGPPAVPDGLAKTSLAERLTAALRGGERAIVISNDAGEDEVRALVEAAFPGESGPLRTNPRIGLTTYSRAAGEALFAKRDTYSLVVLANDPEPGAIDDSIDF